MRGFREAAGLTQQELAERAGLSTNGISALERGERQRPYPHTVRALAAALGLSDDDRSALLRSGRASDDTGAAPLRPAQLPPDVADFVGRHEEASWIASLLTQAGGDADVLSPVTAVAGKAGVGKSALAVHVAYRVRSHFPDGQLYADLAGADDEPEPDGVLPGFLLALGVGTETLPADRSAQAALYRSLLADARVLVVLDNARDEAQVRPLIPGGSTCGVLVTSRARLTALPGAEICDLEDMDLDDAVALLGRIAGPARVHREPAAAATIARLCGRLPLALRIAGATLKAKRHWALTTLVDRLADEHRRLDELRLADLDVRASFALSYADLPQAEAALFRLLGLLPGPDFGMELVAAVAGTDVPSAERRLENLHTAQLLPAPAAGRCRLHDLLRLFARERVEQEEPETDRHAALVRAIAWYAASAGDAAGFLRHAVHPAGPQRDRAEHDALGWFRRELPNLISAAARAVELERHDLCIAITDACRPFFAIQEVHAADQERLQDMALAAARATGDRAAQGRALLGQGDVHRNLGDWMRALGCYQQALAIFRELRDRGGEAQALLELGRTHRRLSRWPEAAAHQELSLAIFRILGDRLGEGRALNSLGLVYEFRAWFSAAVSCYELSLAILRQVGDRHFEAWVLSNLGDLHRSRGRLEEAARCCEGSLDIYEQIGDRDCETWALRALGRVHRDQGRWPDATEHFERSLDACRAHGDREGEAKTLADLAGLLRAQGRWDRAAACCERGLTVFRQLGDRHGESIALDHLGAVHRDLGRWPAAADCHERSLAIRREIGDRPGEVHTLADLGRLDASRGRWSEAIEWYERALGLCRQLEDLRGEARVLELLGDAHRERGAWGRALDELGRGLAIRRDAQDLLGEASVLVRLGDVERDRRRWGDALARYEEGLACHARLDGVRAGEPAALVHLADTLRRSGRPQEAATAYERARSAARRLGDRIREAEAAAGLEGTEVDRHRVPARERPPGE